MGCQRGRHDNGRQDDDDLPQYYRKNCHAIDPYGGVSNVDGDLGKDSRGRDEMARATRKVGIVVILSNFMLEAQRRRGGWMPASTVMASTFWEEGSAEIIVLNGRAIFRTHGKAHDSQVIGK